MAEANHDAAAPHGGTRHRGPHPLPLFLALATEVCGGDGARLARVLAGLRRYQQAPPPAPRPPHRQVAAAGGVTLRAAGDAAATRTVVVVPSLINAPDVLDLAAGNSLLAHLAGKGLRPLLVDWGTAPDLPLDRLVAEHLVPLVATAAEPGPVALLGYCLGGTLALGVAAALPGRVDRVALLATPWHFTGYGEAARAELAQWWQRTAPLATGLGALPMDLLQPAFWQLDREALVAKYERYADLPEGAAASAFVTLEDWANSGAPLGLATARDLAETLFAQDATGRSAWRVAGQTVDPARLGIPILDVIAARDRIVPAATSLSAAGVGTALPLAAGHVGMIVGSAAPGSLWAPLAGWLAA